MLIRYRRALVAQLCASLPPTDISADLCYQYGVVPYTTLSWHGTTAVMRSRHTRLEMGERGAVKVKIAKLGHQRGHQR